MQSKTLYVTEMLKWGSDETHHYIIGIFSTEAAAIAAGEAERMRRGGGINYVPHIKKFVIDSYVDRNKEEYENNLKENEI